MKKHMNSRLLGISLLLSASTLYSCTKQGATSKDTIDKMEVSPVALAAPAITSFVHPGVLNTQASLDYIGGQANGGDAARLASYQKVLDYVNGQTVPTSFYATVVVGSNGATSPSKSQIRRDAELAYGLALRWAKTGTDTYAKQAIQILNGWSYTFKNYALLNSSTNALQPALEASWTTPSFVAAAEIIRYYKPFGKSSGWSDADIAQFSNYLNNVKNNYINKCPVYNNNWNASAAYAKMAIGIFLNSVTVYQNGYNDLVKYLPIIVKSDGSIPELCDRQDCVHFQYSLTAFAYGAELARIQGDNGIYTYNSNLISLGYNFMRAAYNRSTGCNYCTTSSPVFPGTEVAYNYYKTSNLEYLRNLQDPLSIPNDNTFLGFTTYTHFNVPL
ncbi:Alginate lyase [Chitinophaga rupis]|uniref:Alginate lyase n=1 Tax=Chitinophaga rupis TaxID=573321 RepID=A0A1H7HJ97_9BACT|nr:alginate lyase family protein [Chitinophaga rupis]SEK50354.1 Alginate lyase [Chitinophaga rupis]